MVLGLFEPFWSFYDFFSKILNPEIIRWQGKAILFFMHLFKLLDHLWIKWYFNRIGCSKIANSDLIDYLSGLLSFRFQMVYLRINLIETKGWLGCFYTDEVLVLFGLHCFTQAICAQNSGVAMNEYIFDADLGCEVAAMLSPCRAKDNQCVRNS